MDDGILYSHIWDEKEVEDARGLSGPVLVVGASGFIGSKLFFSLSRCRDDVFACSKNARQGWRLAGVDTARLLNVDITDYDRLKKTVERLQPKTVFNLAAYGAYSRQSDVERIHQTNYIGTLNLVRALMDTGCDAFVHAGTSSEYGLNCSGPAESGRLEPNSDYAVSKVGVSYLLGYYGGMLRFPCVNLRLYSVYGPWEERDRLIPVLVSHCLGGKYPDFVDKDISRDFVYIDDCTAAFARAALTACKTDPGAAINIASGQKITLEGVALTARKVFGIPDEPVFGSMTNRRWDLSDWYGDPSLAERLMGWKARTSFEEGLRLCAQWERAAMPRLKTVSIPKKSEKVSVIVACYKDNQSIPILHERLTRVFTANGYDYEIIFVNDASPNDDEEVITRLSSQDSHVIGVSHSRNFGSQSAFMSGMEIATGDAVVLMDGDGQDPPEVVPEFIRKWEEGYDIVYGERVKREASLFMQASYKVFYRLFRKLSDIKIPVDAGDFSLIDRKAVNHLLKFSEKDVFLRGLRAWIGFRQTGVSYVRPERLFGTSTNDLLKNIWWAKKGIFSFSMKPLHYIQSLGVAVFLFTSLLSVFYLVEYFVNPPTDAKGVTTIILLVLGIGSIQLISTSILGDYIGKITEEVKNRPKFIRNKLLYNGKVYTKDEDLAKVVEELKNS